MSTEQRAHHPYSPSTLQNLEACPCYRSTTGDNARSIAGTLAHGVAESGVDDNRLGDADAEAAAECLDFVEQRRHIFESTRREAVLKREVELWGKDIGPERPTYNASELAEQEIAPVLEIKEAYLPIDGVIFSEGGAAVCGTTAGYIDHGFISWDRTYAEIYDWKFGFWPVEEASNNLQGFAYTLGVFHKYPSIETVRFFFKQPHLETISDCVVNRSDVPTIYLRIQTVVAKAREARRMQDYSTATPRIPACNFCANLGKCPKVTAFACKVGSKFHPIEIPENITPTMVLSARDTTLGMRLAQVVEAWARAFKHNTTDRILRGAADVPPGYTLQTRSSREVVNTDAFRQIALRFLTQDEYNAMVEPPGFTKLEEKIKDKTPRGLKTEAVKEFATALEEGGAVQKSPEYTFLRAENSKNKQT